MSEGQMTFKNFVNAVDRNVSRRFGVSIHDLPDIDFHNYWSDICADVWDDMVNDAANEAVELAGGGELI